MLKTLLFATLCQAAFIPAIAKADAPDYLLDCGPQKIVILAGTKSADGRYALGWTLRRINKKAEAIDWSFWDSDEYKLLEHYHMDEDGSEFTSNDYTVDYFAVDLPAKKALKIPADYQYIHGSPYEADSFTAMWSGEVDGNHYGLFQVEYIGATRLFLATFAPEGMRLIDLDGLDEVVDAQLPKHTPLDRYGIIYRLGEDDMGRKIPVFHGPYADVSFYIGIRHEDAPSADGIITLRLADGKVMHLTDDSSGGDIEAAAIQNNPALQKADAGLNKVYQTLERKLTPAARETLKKEQVAWIKTRNAEVDAAAGKAPANTSDYGPIRDKTLLALTLKRTAVLQARLTAH